MNNKIIAFKPKIKKIKQPRVSMMTQYKELLNKPETKELIKQMRSQNIPISIQIYALSIAKHPLNNNPIQTNNDRLEFAIWFNEQPSPGKFRTQRTIADENTRELLFNEKVMSFDKMQFDKSHFIHREYNKIVTGLSDKSLDAIGQFEKNDYLENTPDKETIALYKQLETINYNTTTSETKYQEGRSVTIEGIPGSFTVIEERSMFLTKNSINTSWVTRDYAKDYKKPDKLETLSTETFIKLSNGENEIWVPKGIIEKTNNYTDTEIKTTQKNKKKAIRADKTYNVLMNIAIFNAKLKNIGKVQSFQENGKYYLIIKPNTNLSPDPLQLDGYDHRGKDNFYFGTYKEIKQTGTKTITKEHMDKLDIEVPLVSISIGGNLEMRDHHRIWGAMDQGMSVTVEVELNAPSKN